MSEDVALFAVVRKQIKDGIPDRMGGSIALGRKGDDGVLEDYELKEDVVTGTLIEIIACKIVVRFVPGDCRPDLEGLIAAGIGLNGQAILRAVLRILERTVANPIPTLMAVIRRGFHRLVR